MQFGLTDMADKAKFLLFCIVLALDNSRKWELLVDTITAPKARTEVALLKLSNLSSRLSAGIALLLMYFDILHFNPFCCKGLWMGTTQFKYWLLSIERKPFIEVSNFNECPFAIENMLTIDFLLFLCSVGESVFVVPLVPILQ